MCFISGVVGGMPRDIEVVKTAIGVNPPDAPVGDADASEGLCHFYPTIQRHAIVGNAVSGGCCAFFAIAIKCLIGIGDAVSLAQRIHHKRIVYPACPRDFSKINMVFIKEIFTDQMEGW